MERYKKHLELVRKISSKVDVILTGSLSLMMLGIYLKRDKIDIDFICKDEKQFSMLNRILVDLTPEVTAYSDTRFIYTDGNENITIDFFLITPNNRYHSFEHEGFNYTIADPVHTIYAKLGYAINGGTEKHYNDVMSILLESLKNAYDKLKLEELVRIYRQYQDSLPF